MLYCILKISWASQVALVVKNLPANARNIRDVGSIFPGGSDGKEFACSAGDLGSISGSGRSSGEGNGYPFQYSCLEISMDRGAWEVTVDGVAKSRTQLSN